MPNITTGSTSIVFGASLRIGYRLNGSISPYTYLGFTPSSNDLPYVFSVPSLGQWQIEYTQICPNCSGSIYSDPQTVIVNVT